MAAAVAATSRTNNPDGRPSAAKLAQRLERVRLRNVALRAENASLLAEVGRLGTELIAIGRRLDLVYQAERPDLALHYAGRLEDLGQACVRRAARSAT